MSGALTLLLCAAAPAASAPPLANPPTNAHMAQRVREEFQHAWNGYKRYAWGFDELAPLTRTGRNWHRESLLMTPVDSLSTLVIMGLNDEASGVRELIASRLRFDHDIEVKNFEVTIRILGGLVSGYQLTGDRRLLALADDLGTRLLPVFNSPTGMPYMFVNLKTGAVRGSVTNPAEVGTLLIEFGALGRLTGKQVYYDKAKRALVELYKRRSPIGLVGATINVETGQWVDPSSHISGGIDSYYEYLLKCFRLFADKECKTMWQESIRAVNAHLAHEVDGALWYAQVDMKTGARFTTRFGALDAFLPAVLMLGGDKKRARRLQESSYLMWTRFGIEPEQFDYTTTKVTSAGYPLRPEIIESAYYLYFYTRDPRYLEMGRTFFDSLVKHCRTDAGYAALSNVETREQRDNMESFFLAETLKYLYLLFAPRETLDLDAVVFNTEAHPIRRTWSKDPKAPR